MSDRVVDGELHGLTPERFLAALEWRLYGARRWIVRAKRKCKAKAVQRILSDSQPKRVYDSDELFAELQKEYPPRSPYGYDDYATWCRATHRAQSMLTIPELHEPPKQVLELGAGDGMTARLLSDYGHEVLLCDIDDWRDPRARHLPFQSRDVCKSLPLEDGSFDFIYSYNTFEHLHDPLSAFREVTRLCRPKGLIVLSFGPLYCSPWGLHAYRALRMPYPQFLFSRSFVDEKLEHIGIHDLGRHTTTLQPLNEWRLTQFRQLWCSHSFEILKEHTTEDWTHLDVVLSHAEAFHGMGLTVADLITQGVYVLLKKMQS